MARRSDVIFVKRALALLPILGCLVGPISAVTALLYTPMRFSALCLLAAMSLIVYGTDSLLWIRTSRASRRALDTWESARTPATAAAAWPAVADLPLAPLRQPRTYVVMIALLLAWDNVAVRVIGLPAHDFLLFLPGSLLQWTYWLALRLLLTELLIRPVLAEISIELPNDAGAPTVSISLNQRLVVAVAGTILFAGTIVSGIVGPTTLTTLVIGFGASCAVAIVTSWSVALLANSIAAPIAHLRLAAQRIGNGDLTTRVPIVSTDEIGVLARAFNSMADGLRERERIRTAFGTYLDPAVADHVLREGPALTGAEVEVTALFLDVRGFTGYAERHPAREVVAKLNDLFELVVPIVRSHGGHVDKFVGDGLLAVFGAPLPCEDHADRALAAALDIVAAVRRTRCLAFEIAMGLNSGQVIAGNIGGAGRFDYSVIGDPINVAARVEAATRGTGDVVLLSEQTRQLLRAGHDDLIARPGILLKGKSAPATLYAPTVGAGRTERSAVDHPPHRGG